MNKIIRVWGNCDNLQINFEYEGGTSWICRVPPDLKDGVYASEFWAEDWLGRIGHWCGFLYMSSGVCHFKFKEEKYQFWFKPQNYSIKFNNFEDKNYIFNFNKKDIRYKINFNIDDYIFKFKESRYKISFEKGCKHWEL